MKHTYERGPKNDVSFGTAQDEKIDREVDVRLTCNHCGGSMKQTPDGASCFMCGRDIDHRCENCLRAA